MVKCPPELYDLRYAPNWNEIRRKALAATDGKCVLCDRDAKEVHHAMYADSRGAIAGSEVPGVHIFPLCKYHHKQAHSSRNWRFDSGNPLFGNRNTDKFLLRLRSEYLMKVT